MKYEFLEPKNDRNSYHIGTGSGEGYYKVVMSKKKNYKKIMKFSQNVSFVNLNSSNKSKKTKKLFKLRINVLLLIGLSPKADRDFFQNVNNRVIKPVREKLRPLDLFLISGA